jgi:predicted ATP-dependent protease
MSNFSWKSFAILSAFAGGLKEKMLAALRGGIKTVIIPNDNERELSEVPEKIKGKLNVIKVKWIDEVLDIALEKYQKAIDAYKKPLRLSLIFIHYKQPPYCNKPYDHQA